MQTRFEKEAYRFLAVYRFFAYALAVMFIEVTPPPGAPRIPDLQTIIILSILGVYTLLKVFAPLRWREGSPMTYLILAGDYLLCLLLIIITNGLDSAFLLYSLTPIMTAALFFEEKVALSLAAVASLSLSITCLVLSQFSESFTWVTGHHLTLLIIYTIFCFVIVILTYRTNLNIRRRVETDAIIDERRRVAREIHDGVAQSLGYLNLKTKLVSDSVSSHNTEQALIGLEDIREVVKDTYENVRESIDQLSTEVRSRRLIPALVDYTKEFSEKTNIKVKVAVPKVFPQLSPVAELQLLRIAQEALTNIRRHAQATTVGLKLENNPTAIKMIVKDNGRGFTLYGYDKTAPGYHGLSIIKERAEELGGTLTISTTPGEGTEVKVSLPIEKVRL